MRKSRGFTLIEVMVVAAIIALLASIAYPSYNNYVLRTRRAEGKEFLMRVAAAQERYFTTMNRYGSLSDVGFASNTSENGYYAITATLANSDQTYSLQAAPAGGQTSDQCGDLSLTNTGAKSFSGAESNGRCW